MKDKPHADPGARDDAAPIEIEAGPVAPDEILAVRRGPGANCSSIGSALDLLFVSATLAGVVMAGIAAAIGDADEDRKTGGSKPSEPSEPSKSEEDVDAGAR